MNKMYLKALVIGIMLIWLVIGFLLTPLVQNIMWNFGFPVRGPELRYMNAGYLFLAIILVLIVTVVFAGKIKEMFHRFVNKVHLKALAVGIMLTWLVLGSLLATLIFLLPPDVIPGTRDFWGYVFFAFILVLIVAVVFAGKVKEVVDRFVACIFLVFHSFPALAWFIEPLLYVMVFPVGIFALLCSPLNPLFVFPPTRRLLDVVIFSPFPTDTHELIFLLRVCLYLLAMFLFPIGIAIFATALIQLLKGKGGLVTSGLYSVVRHPQYLGIILATLGLTFFEMEVRLISLIAWIMLIFAYVWLARREESKLQKKYGEEFLAYKRRTPFILPLPTSARKK